MSPPTPKPAPSIASRAPAWLSAFIPAPFAVDSRERLRVVIGAALGILVTALVCHALDTSASWPWLVAPLGASAVLVFGVPASPLAQPWSVVGGNTLSALAGITCVHFVGQPELAAALAVGAAIALMFATRCLHPPGGAMALLVALTGVTDYRFAIFPALTNSLLLAGVGIAYNNATKRAYPHRQLAAAPPTARDDEAAAIDADLDRVLARYNQVLDISRDDLKALLADTQMRAFQRKLDNVRCSDIMSRRLITVGYGTPLAVARALFGEHRIKALPVIDASGGIIGIVTPADFTGATADAAFSVGQIMTRQVRVASVDRHLADLIPLFGSSGHHHIPVVGDNGKLVGIITQSDVVAALCRTPEPAAVT